MQVLLRHKHLSTTSFGYWRLLLPQKKLHGGFHSRAPLVSYVRLRAHSGDPKAPMALLLPHKHLLTIYFGFWRLLLPRKKSHRGFTKNLVSSRSHFFFEILAPEDPTRPRAEIFWVVLSSLQCVNPAPASKMSACPPRRAQDLSHQCPWLSLMSLTLIWRSHDSLHFSGLRLSLIASLKDMAN